MEKMAWDGPEWGQDDFFQLIQTLPTFWAERIWNLRISTFFILWIQNFWMSRFPDLPNLAWAGPGLDLGGGPGWPGMLSVLMLPVDCSSKAVGGL